MPTIAAFMFALLVTSLPGTGTSGTVEGVDVSHWQGDIEWASVAGAGIEFAFVKSTEGVAYTDPKFHYNWREIGKAGLARGAYHFLDPSRDGAEQARHFLHVVGRLHPGDLLPAVDVERMKRSSNRELARVLDAFTDQIRRDTGLECVLYVSPGFWKEHLLPVQETMRKQPLWITEYEAREPSRLTKLPPWTIWQYTKEGRVTGIEGRCDRSQGRGIDAIRIPRDWKPRSEAR